VQVDIGQDEDWRRCISCYHYPLVRITNQKQMMIHRGHRMTAVNSISLWEWAKIKMGWL
jgi:hypothetical protein